MKNIITALKNILINFINIVFDYIVLFDFSVLPYLLRHLIINIEEIPQQVRYDRSTVRYDRSTVRYDKNAVWRNTARNCIAKTEVQEATEFYFGEHL